MKKHEKELLNLLREDSRKTLVQINKETDIPISTLANKLKSWGSSIILKHSSLIDFAKLGYTIKAGFVLQGGLKNEIERFLMNHPNVNSLYRLIGNHDIYAECVFRNMNELSDFKENITAFGIKSLEQIDLLEEIKREGFRLE